MAHQNGRIYIDTTTTPHKGVEIADLQQVLGRATGYLGQLCTDQEWYDTGNLDGQGNPIYALRPLNPPRINKWARYKPCASTILAVLTLEQRRAANCGIDCSDTATGCFSTNLSSLIARAKANKVWNKEMPTVYRLRDFEGYNHYASIPYEPIDDIVGNTTGDPTTNISIVLRANVESDNIQVSDLVGALTKYGNTVGQFTEGLLIKDSMDASASPVILTSNNSTYVFPAPSTYASPKVYDCVFIKYVNNNGTYWAVFYPNTYFQAKISLFYVSVENQTLNFTAQGGETSLIIAGYDWEANWGGKGNPNADLVMAMSPAQGGQVSNWAEVTLTVSPSTPQYTSMITKTVIVSVPGGFTKQFTVKQACSLKTGYIALVDANNQDAGSEVILNRSSIDAEQDIRIRSDRSWKIADQNTAQGAGIVYRIIGDDTGTYYDGRNDINLSPSSATITTGQHTTTTVTIGNLIALPSNRAYEVLFVSLDGVASFRLRINTQH